MDPVTALLVAPASAGIVITSRSRWEDFGRSMEGLRRQSSETVRKPWQIEEPATARMLPLTTLPTFTDKFGQLRNEIQAYVRLDDGWDGEGSLRPSKGSEIAALAFLDAIPGGLPLPVTMVSSQGKLEFYWDLPGGYADISFDAEGKGSFFSRDNDNREVFVDDLQSENFTKKWCFQMIGPIAGPTTKAA